MQEIRWITQTHYAISLSNLSASSSASAHLRGFHSQPFRHHLLHFLWNNFSPLCLFNSTAICARRRLPEKKESGMEKKRATIN